MSKAVLISIKPKWCELIVNGNKTIEVRKTKPKLETPFKVYIYSTKPKNKNDLGLCLDKGMFGTLKKVGLLYKRNYETAKHLNMQILSGKVIGEFVCKGFETLDEKALLDGMDEISDSRIEYYSCVSVDELLSYKGNKPFVYGWHISDLVIYDWPRALCLFNHPHYKDCDIECGKCKYGFPTEELSFEDYICDRALQRAPQSWCYVEEAK